MKVKFKQAVHLDGKNYSRGVHDVPEKSFEHAYFHKLLKAGLVSDPESPPVEVLTEKQRQDRLSEKVMSLASKAVPKAPPADLNSVPKAIEPDPKDDVVIPDLESPPEPGLPDGALNLDEFGEEEVESPAQEPFEEPKGKKKKKG